MASQTQCRLGFTFLFLSFISLAHALRPKITHSLVLGKTNPSRSSPIVSIKTTTTGATAISASLAVRGGNDDGEMAMSAFEWCSNLGAPAALVGGAVLATMEGTRQETSPKRSDSRSRRLLKQFTRMLLLSAFALEIISIFCTTVTGTMLLAHGDVPTGTKHGEAYHSPMGFMEHNFEFEYLTARITFLQGLFHWLLATAVGMALPQPGEGEAARRMNAFISASMVSMVFLMISFYNAHMTFYDNYAQMLWAFGKSFYKRFFIKRRAMQAFYIPSLIVTAVLGWRTLMSPSEMDIDDA